MGPAAAAAKEGGGDGAPNDGAASSSACSLFWEGDQPDDFENHPDFLAMQAAMDEFTPFEEAEAWKKQGNDKVRIARKAAYPHMKRRYHREAVELYTRAIAKARLDPEATPSEFLSTCFNNRAQVNLTLGNFRSALADAEEAAKLDSTSKKAYFRGVKAALELRDVEKALELGKRGAPHAGDDKEYGELMRQATRMAEEVEKKARAESEAAEESLGTAVAFAGLLRDRKVKVALPSFPDIQNKPYLDEEGVMHWPVVLVYPESGQVELIEDFPENSAFRPFADMMFQEEEPTSLPWDERDEYTKSRIRFYYSSAYSEQSSDRAIPR